ncbi:hypothetical protein MJ904_20835 [Massilia sp. MB5]|uniref:hypothetical protein n=1 Tax=Massilia sp. MB5 TaxID=2919578 RepID=UPI001F0EC111|nr:hypothetical protein [Massilia sp. MB5]UMR29485.1 hypothetical protein MJ904_20835 [Massilia sp. MB5]
MSDGTVAAFGMLGGTVSCLKDLFVGIQLPMQGDTWVFGGKFAKPVGIADVIQLAGGINLANVVPPPLNIVGGIGVSAATLTYNAASSTLESLSFTVTQTDPEQLFTLFPFLPGFPQVGGLTLNFIVIDPVKVRKTLFDFSGKVVFPAAGDAPRPTLVLSGSLPNFRIQGELEDNGALLGVDDILHIILPPAIKTGIKGGFKSLSFLADTPNSNYSFAGTFNADWDITVSTSLFTIPLVIKELTMSLQRSGKRNGGSFGGVIQIGQDGAKDSFQLSVMANTPVGSQEWTYRGWLSQGTISLSALLYTFTNGVFKIPADVFDLVVDGLNVEISSGGSYHFEIGASMTLPFGIGTIKGFLGVYSNGIIPAGSGIPRSQMLLEAPSLLAPQRGLLAYAAPAADKPVPAYRLMASYTLLNIDWTLTVDMRDKDDYRYFLSLSDYLTGEYKTDPKTKETTVTISFGNVSLGDIVALLLSWAVPGGARSLSPPWDLLNNIPLNNLVLIVNTTKKKVSISYPANGKLGLNFGIFTLNGISLTYQPKQGSASKYEVIVDIDGQFLTGTPIPSWDATDPDSAPVPAGSGNKYLDIRLLALGQHVTISGYESFDSVQAAINAMRSLKAPEAGAGIPVAANPPRGQPMFNAKSNWLIAMNFGVLRFGGDSKNALQGGAGAAKAGYLLDLSIIFNDPNLYALRFALDGPAAKVLAGLAFEIMYKKVSDSVGMYQAKLALPNAVRQLQFGACGVTLPNFGVQVFTNGDFLVDIGFPYNNDFSVSFAIQVQAGPLPLLGAGGVYFGKLSSATTSVVPTTTHGLFNPVIVLGIGLQVGLGKDINIGIMQAGFSLTVFGIIEGVYAAYNPFDGSASSDFFLVKGTLGLIGRLYGTINFAIISADFEIVVRIYVQASYQSYCALPISIAASVDIRLTVKISLGFFTIRIGLSFSATVKETLVIGTDQSADAPWNRGASGRHALLEGRRNLHVLRAAYQPQRRKRLVMTTLKHTMEADKKPLTLYYGPAQTVASKSGSGALADQTSRIVHLLYIDTANESFTDLCLELFNWLVTSYHPEGSSRAAMQDTVISYTDLLDIYHELKDPGTIMPLSVEQIDHFLNDHVAVRIAAADPGRQEEKSVAIFPMPPEVMLTAPGGKQRTLSSFTTCTGQYVKTVSEYFRDLQMQVENDLAAEQSAALRRKAEAEPPFSQSVAALVFQDFFVMLASQLVQYGLDAMTHYKYALNGHPNSLSGIVAWANGMRPASGINENNLTFSALAEANRDAPLAGGTRITISGCTCQVASGATLQAIVDLYGSGLSVQRLIEQNSEVQYLINGGVTIVNSAGAKIFTRSDSTFASLQAEAEWPAPEFAAATARLAGLLTNRSMMSLPDLAYTTEKGNTDTLGLIANRYASSAADIANAAANQDIAPFFHSSAADPRYLDLPHLYCLTVKATLDEIKNCNSLQQLAGMVSRFLVYGMRLPVGPGTGLSFNDPSDQPCSGEDCAMYSVTGQQFELPPLSPTDAVEAGMAAAPKAPAWLRTALNGSATVKFSAEMIQALNVVLDEARSKGVQPLIDSLGIAAMRDEQPVQYDFAQMIPWQADGPVALPYGAPDPQEKAPVPYIWPFSRSVLSYLASTAAGLPNPKVALEIGSVDPATGQRVTAGCRYYGWGALLNFSIKKVASGGNAYTYELLGADELGVMILERLLAASTPAATPVAQLAILFAPNAASNNDAGLVSAAAADTAYFITQANLSTYTNPAGALEAAAAQTAQAPGPQGLLGTVYNFIKLLWECSITRSGGYYLYYENIAAHSGLSDLLFDANGAATLRLLLTYAASGAGVQENRLYDYMNVAVTGQNIDPAANFLLGEAAPFQHTTVIGGSETLDEIALKLNLPAGQAAEALGGLALASDVSLVLNDLVYQAGVAAPGQDIASIASYYMTTAVELEAANQGRGLDFGKPIPVWTALRIPPLRYAVSSARAGATLASIAAYFGAALPKLAAENAGIAGIFPATTKTLDLFFTKVSTTTPPGCLALSLRRRNPGELPKPGQPGYRQGQLYLQQSYNLLSYRLTGLALHNPAFPTTKWGIPVGPTTKSDAPAADKIRAIPAEDNGAEWEYHKSVPAYHILNGAPTAGGDGLPPVAADPYSVLNRIAQVEFVWRDLYGNETITPLSDPVLFPDGPKNAPPALLGYTDALIPFSGWPSMAPQYLFIKAASDPALVLVLFFDTSPYTADANNPGKQWQDQARKDLEVYKSIYYQLCQPSLQGQGDFAVRFFILSSLLAGDPAALTQSQADVILQAVKTIVLYLQARAAGNDYAPPPTETCKGIVPLPGIPGDGWNRWCLATPLPAARQNQEELFELRVELAIERNRAFVAAEFADDSAVYHAVTTIDPYVARQAGAGGKDDKAPTYALDAFAAEFERIFTVADAYSLKLASGYDRFSSGAAAGEARKPLWVVRMALTDAGGIYFGQDGAARFFAPTPLATSLQSETVEIHPWSAAQGMIDPAQRYAATFQNIDMDVWMNAFFTAIDELLAPELISQAFLVDYLSGGSVLPHILQAKENLAAAYATSRTAPLLAEQRDSDPAVAAERLRQQMLVKLGEAYKVTTIVSYPMRVKASFHGADAGVAPRLYGTPQISAGDAGGGEGKDRNYSFSSAKLALAASGKSDLSFLFYAKRPGDSALADFQIGYAVTNLEHDIGPVSGIDHYEASSWLSFLLPPGAGSAAAANPLYKNLGPVSIPIPLRAYPAAPSMTSQNQRQILPAQPKLAQILQWDYLYGYSNPAMQQDTVHTVVRMNLAGPLPTALEADDSKKLFQVLAQFTVVQDDLNSSFSNYLRRVDRQMQAGDEIVLRAKRGLESLLSLMNDAATYLPKWLASGGVHIDEAGNYYVITQGADPVYPARFMVTLKPDSAYPVVYPELPAPLIQLDGYATVAADQNDSYWFTQELGGVTVYLDPATARTIDARQIVIANLPLFQYQNAWSAAYVKRNEFFGARKAAERFVYTSQLAKFASLLVPLIDNSNPIAVYQSGTGHAHAAFAGPASYAEALPCRSVRVGQWTRADDYPGSLLQLSHHARSAGGPADCGDPAGSAQALRADWHQHRKRGPVLGRIGASADAVVYRPAAKLRPGWQRQSHWRLQLRPIDLRHHRQVGEPDAFAQAQKSFPSAERPGYAAVTSGRKQGGKFFGGDRASIQIALSLFAAQQFEQFGFLFRFDAFGHHLQVERVGQRDDGVDQAHIAGVLGHLHHEGAVHLQHIDRQRDQVGQRGITGAEVVDGNRHVQAADAVQDLGHTAVVRHQAAFGDFNRQRMVARARGFQRVLDIAQQGIAAELGRRHIDGDLRRLQAGVVPAAPVFHGALHDLAAGGDYQAAAFQQRHEFGRRHQAALRMAPAYQRLGASQASRLQIDLGLVVVDEFLALDGVAQLGFQADLARGQAQFLAVVDAEAQLTVARAGQRIPGFYQQGVGIHAVLGQRGRADIDGAPDLVLLDLVGALQQRHDGLVHKILRRVFQRGRQEEREAADADMGEQHALVHRGTQALGDHAHQADGGGIAVGRAQIVEAVDIHQQHRAGYARCGQRGDLLFELQAAGQSGKRIGARQPVQLLGVDQALQAKTQLVAQLAGTFTVKIIEEIGALGVNRNHAPAALVDEERNRHAGSDIAAAASLVHLMRDLHLAVGHGLRGRIGGKPVRRRPRLLAARRPDMLAAIAGGRGEHGQGAADGVGTGDIDQIDALLGRGHAAGVQAQGFQVAGAGNNGGQARQQDIEVVVADQGAFLLHLVGHFDGGTAQEGFAIDIDGEFMHQPVARAVFRGFHGLDDFAMIEHGAVLLGQAAADVFRPEVAVVLAQQAGLLHTQQAVQGGIAHHIAAAPVLDPQRGRECSANPCRKPSARARRRRSTLWPAATRARSNRAWRWAGSRPSGMAACKASSSASTAKAMGLPQINEASRDSSSAVPALRGRWSSRSNRTAVGGWLICCIWPQRRFIQTVLVSAVSKKPRAVFPYRWE